MKTFRNIERKYPVDISSSNSVDKDVQSMLLPLNLMQYMMFCPKYRIKNNIITPNSLLSNFVSMITTLIFIIIFILNTYMTLYVQDGQALRDSDLMHYIYFYNCFFYCFGFAMNFVIGIIQAKNYIQFVLIFQKVHSFVNDESSFYHFIIWNWILGLVALGFYVIVSTFFYIKLLPFVAVYACYFTVFFDFNILYATRIIKVLQNKIILWKISVVYSQKSENSQEESCRNKVFQAYVNIVECYNIHKNCFHQFILYYILEVFIHSLVYIQVAFNVLRSGEMIKTTNKTTMLAVFIFIWLIKNFTWQTILIQECEKFYLAVQSVQDTCALILKSNCSDYEKKLYKNVLRLHRASFSKIRVGGLFYVDAGLQLSLMSLLTNYTVVLLQFAIL